MYQRPSDHDEEAAMVPGAPVLFTNANGLTRVDAANSDVGVGRRFRDLETQKMWLLIQKAISVFA